MTPDNERLLKLGFYICLAAFWSDVMGACASLVIGGDSQRRLIVWIVTVVCLSVIAGVLRPYRATWPARKKRRDI